MILLTFNFWNKKILMTLQGVMYFDDVNWLQFFLIQLKAVTMLPRWCTAKEICVPSCTMNWRFLTCWITGRSCGYMRLLTQKSIWPSFWSCILEKLMKISYYFNLFFFLVNFMCFMLYIFQKVSISCNFIIEH